MKNINCNIQKTLDLAKQLLFLADVGDLQREDAGCGVLFGVVRDCAYKIQAQASREREMHKARGIWDSEEE